MKNKFLLLPYILLLVSCFPKQQNRFSVFGNKIYEESLKMVASKKLLNFFTGFINEDEDFKKSFYYFDEKPTIYIDNSTKIKFDDFIKSNDFLIFSYDIDTIFPQYLATYTADEYQKEYALFDYYLEKTYEEVNNIYTDKVICLGLFSKKEKFYSGAIEDFNNLIYEKTLKYNFNFISTLFLNDFIKDEKITEKGNEILAEQIISTVYEL